MKTEISTGLGRIDSKPPCFDAQGLPPEGLTPANSRLLPPCNEAGEPKKALSAPTPTGRIAGYDLARAVAILGMLLVNFDSIADPLGDDPAWLRSFIGMITGRAAVIFVVLAGVGISLKARSVRRTDGPTGIRHFRLALLKRGMVLFVVGIVFNLIWPADILHFYGVYMAIGAALLTAPQRRLLITAVMSIIISALWLTLFDADLGIYNWLLPSQDNPWSLSGMGLDLFFHGYYSVLPWTAFLILGMWMGRLDISRAPIRLGLLITGLILYWVADSVAERMAIWVLNLSSDHHIEVAMWWLTIDPWTPLPVFVLSGAGTAVVVVTGCIWASEILKQNRLHRALLAAGRMSLTVYVAHILVGMGLNRLYPADTQVGLAAVTATALVVFAVILVFCTFWSLRYKKGPLEGWIQKVVSITLIRRIKRSSFDLAN